MKVIRKSNTPNGTNIQIEDWREKYPFIKTLEIAVYPKAKNTSKYGWVKNNEKFRLGLVNFNSDEEVETIFEKLESGEIVLEELTEHFREGHKDKFYLGLVNTEEIEQEQEGEEI